MKGNIEPVKKGFMNPAIRNGFNKKFAEEFDIDNVIPKNDQRERVSEDPDHDSMASFKLSLNGLDKGQLEYTQNSQYINFHG